MPFSRRCSAPAGRFSSSPFSTAAATSSAKRSETGFRPRSGIRSMAQRRSEDRQAIVDAFTAYAGPACLVLNPKAAGAGLNITAATVVIHYTQAWNPALEAQASARAHRRGQTEPVRIYRLFYEDTVERVMIDRAAWRREMGNDAVPVSTRDANDLQRALTLRPKREDR